MQAGARSGRWKRKRREFVFGLLHLCPAGGEGGRGDQTRQALKKSAPVAAFAIRGACVFFLQSLRDIEGNKVWTRYVLVACQS